MKVKVFRGMTTASYREARKRGYLDLDWQGRLYVTTELWTARYYAWMWTRGFSQAVIISFCVDQNELIPDEYGMAKAAEGKEVEFFIHRRIPSKEFTL